MAEKEFGNIAEMYDILSDPQMRIEREGALLRQFAGKGRVLDLACATGVHAEFLARWGAEVVACDVSEEMIAYAKTKRFNDRVQYCVSDMRNMPKEKFDFIMVIGNSLNMLSSVSEAEAVILQAFDRLEKGGAFLVHVINPECPVHSTPTMIHKQGSVGERKITVVKSMLPVSDGRLVTVSYFALDGNAGKWSTRSSANVLLDINRENLSAMLDKAGFNLVEWFGGLDRVPYTSGGSPDIVAISKR